MHQQDEDKMEIIDPSEPQKTPSLFEKRFTPQGAIAFVVAMGAIWFVGAILSPLFPEELIVMIIYAILYFFFGFDITKIVGNIFKKKP